MQSFGPVERRGRLTNTILSSNYIFTALLVCSWEKRDKTTCGEDNVEGKQLIALLSSLFSSVYSTRAQ